MIGKGIGRNLRPLRFRRIGFDKLFERLRAFEKFDGSVLRFFRVMVLQAGNHGHYIMEHLFVGEIASAILEIRRYRRVIHCFALSMGKEYPAEYPTNARPSRIRRTFSIPAVENTHTADAALYQTLPSTNLMDARQK